jgi:hypothetical protein
MRVTGSGVKLDIKKEKLMYDINVNTGVASYNVKNLGPQGSEASVVINGQGTIHFNDLGDRKFGPNKQTWGVCITFRDRVWAFRYEGQGALSIDYNSASNSLKLNPTNGTVAELTS